MTKEQLRELDTWLAKNIFGWYIVNEVNMNDQIREGEYWWRPEDGDPLAPKWGAALRSRPLFYSSSCLDFQRIKREIEKRGWSWTCQQYSNRRLSSYHFFIYDEDYWQIAAKVSHETEELAGCLAFKVAIEATNGKDENPDGAG